MEKTTDRTLIRKLLPLDTSSWEALVNAFRLEEIKALPAVHRCPGCNDEAVGKLILVTDKNVYEKVFEGNDPPKVMEKLIVLMENGFYPQISPEAEMDYFQKSQHLTHILAMKPTQMDSLLLELDTLDRQLSKFLWR